MPQALNILKKMQDIFPSSLSSALSVDKNNILPVGTILFLSHTKIMPYSVVKHNLSVASSKYCLPDQYFVKTLSPRQELTVARLLLCLI